MNNTLFIPCVEV